MPFAVENHSPFPHFAFQKTGPDGSLFHVLAVRATFDWVAEGTAAVAPEQAPVVVGDRHVGPREDGDLRFESDLVIGKPRADVHVIGDAHAAHGEPAPAWSASLRVGSLFKQMRVTGPRFWEPDGAGWKLSPPEPVARVPLSYRVAYGGTRRREAPSGPEEDAFAPNPVGVGYAGRFPIEAERWPAPQTEALDAPLRAITDAPQPEGFGPLDRAWATRRARCGSLTPAFVRDNPGKLPPDFDWAFYNSSHPDLTYPGFLEGDEPLATEGLFPEGPASCRLPGYRAIAVLFLDSGMSVTAAPRLDTLTIDTEARKIYATWRLTLSEVMGLRGLVLGFAVPAPPPPAGDVLYPLRRRA